MSFYSQDPRRRRGGAGAGFNSSGNRTVMGYWVPLALTVGIATAGVAAWIWSERSDDDDEGDRAADDERHEGYPTYGPNGVELPPDEGYRGVGTDIRGDHPDDISVMARMQGALRRTPSPQQIFDGASKRVAAGVAAAGAFMGGLTSIREEDRGDFEDHSRWSEEVRSQANERAREAAAPTMSGALPSRAAAGQSSLDKKKKTIVIVVSSVGLNNDSDDIGSEHASILSHLPEHINPDNAKIFVLIYAPDLKHAPGQSSTSRPTPSITSSYSNIAPEEAASSGELPPAELSTVEPSQMDDDEPTPLFKTLYLQAQAIVEKDSTIMPFNSPNGYVHLVRHLSPDLVYIQESLTGSDGDSVDHISNWVRQVIVVVGDEGGRGGLIDSEDESALADNGEKWWEKEGTTGIGKRIDVVDVLRVGDDWRRRVQGLD